MSIKNLIQKEIKRQKETISLIPSENYVSEAVLRALGSPLTNKYSEGYPGKRYYPGNAVYDDIEREVQNLARKVFGLSEKKFHVNVQPYSGSPANLAVYSALLEPGDVMMGMSLSHGGHLTHGHKVNLSGKLYHVVQYGVRFDNGRIDYKKLETMAKQFKPKMIISGITAYSRKVDFKKIGRIAQKVHAYHLADISHIAGLVATGLHPSPFAYADIVTTTTHKTLRGPRAAVVFSRKTMPKIQSHASKTVHWNAQLQIHELVDRAVFPGMQGGPHNNVIAAMGIAFEEALRPDFRKYQKQVVKNAKALAEALKRRFFRTISGGTDNHMFLVDLRNIGLTGKEAEKKLENAGILANRNTIPEDESPFNPMGIRMGTPAITTRGAKEKHMRMLADIIHKALTKNIKLSILKKKSEQLLRSICTR